ncbi:tyrosine-type recombinase/integrase [Marinobacterium aestuariivivens]|uniref:Tyrosine-type recombinase/integrase n=1 Tax=Marinobacterium aestuariivivens TaxID=1698799 RepID=A0ABW1ZZD2_9GAMM
MGRLTDTQIRGMTDGDRRSESVELGGSLVIWCKKSTGAKEFYYRKRQKGEKETNVKLGTYPQLPLAAARKKAGELAVKASEVSDLKFRLEQERAEREAAEEAAKRAKERADSLGTLADLCKVYVDKMQSEGRSSWKKVDDALHRYVLDPYPELAMRKANQITSDSIADILAAMIAKGITTHVNRTRGDLHAAFNVGLKYDYNPTLRSKVGLCFEIHHNPVARVPAQKRWERALSRNLSAEELSTVWHAAPEHMSSVYSSLFRLMVCTGFHPAELLRLTVKDVDLKECAIYMIETKTGAPNLIPLNQYAIAELLPLVGGRLGEEALFPSLRRDPKSDIYARVSVVANQVSRLRSGVDVEHFTARDIRRTVKTLMGKAGISKEIRDHLQNHAVSDVSGKHYDRYDYWREKRAAMQKWERWLTAHVLSPDSNSGNVVSFA